MTVGTATFAIVAERTIAIAPDMPAIVTSHLLVAEGTGVDKVNRGV